MLFNLFPPTWLCSHEATTGRRIRPQSQGTGAWARTLQSGLLVGLLTLVGSRVASLVVLEFSLRAVSAWVTDGRVRTLDGAHMHAHTHTLTHKHKNTHSLTNTQKHALTHTKHTNTHSLTNTQKHTHSHSHKHKNTLTHKQKHTHTLTQTQKHTHSHKTKHTRTLTHKHTLTQTYKNTHTLTQSHKHTDTHSHKHKNTLSHTHTLVLFVSNDSSENIVSRPPFMVRDPVNVSGRCSRAATSQWAARSAAASISSTRGRRTAGSRWRWWRRWRGPRPITRPACGTTWRPCTRCTARGATAGCAWPCWPRGAPCCPLTCAKRCAPPSPSRCWPPSPSSTSTSPPPPRRWGFGRRSPFATPCWSCTCKVPRRRFMTSSLEEAPTPQCLTVLNNGF